MKQVPGVAPLNSPVENGVLGGRVASYMGQMGDCHGNHCS
jgi:hypothetical protein